MELPIKWGVIGCGAVTEKKSTPAYQLVEGFSVASVFGRNSRKVEDYIQRHDIPHGGSDFSEFIQLVDAVYIATPPDSHLEYAIKVLQYKKPCCIEKPISNNTLQAAELVAAFKKAQVPLFVSYYRRSLPRFLKIKDWLDTGKIGEVRHVAWQFAKPPNDWDINRKVNWRTDCSVAPGGYFDDVASHGVDLICFLLGEISIVNGVSTNQQGLYSAKDAIAGSWLHKNGVTGNGFWNFGANEKVDRLEIFGSEGRISFSVFMEQPIQLKSNTTNDSLEISNPENIQFYHADNIRKHLLGQSSHPSTGETALHTNWVMDQIIKDPTV